MLPGAEPPEQVLEAVLGAGLVLGPLGQLLAVVPVVELVLEPEARLDGRAELGRLLLLDCRQTQSRLHLYSRRTDKSHLSA